MASPTLVKSLQRKLKQVDIHLLRRQKLTRPVGEKTIRHVDCIGWYDGQRTIHIAVKGHARAEDVISTLVHELLHAIGYDEKAIEDGLEQVAMRSRAVREAVAMRVLTQVLPLNRPPDMPPC